MEQRENVTKVLTSLSNLYLSVKIIDLQEKRILPVKDNVVVDELLGQDIPLQECFDRFIEHATLRGEKKPVKEFFDIETLPVRIRGKQKVFLDYSSGINGWCRADFIRMEEGDPVKRGVFLLEKNEIRKEPAIVDDTFSREQERVDLLINGLSKEYQAVWYLDTSSKNVSLVRDNINSKIIAAMNRELRGRELTYESVMGMYIDNFIIPEDRERLRLQTSISELMTQVPEEGIYRINYVQQNVEGERRHFQMCYVRDVNAAGNVCFACGFNDVEMIFRQEEKNRKAQERRELLINGLSREYVSLWYIDSLEGTAKLMRDEHSEAVTKAILDNSEGTGYEDVFASYVRQFVIPEDRTRLLKETQISELVRKVPSDGIYRINYGHKDFDGNLRHFQVCFARDTNAKGAACFACGFRDVEQMFREEQERRQEVETRDLLINGLSMEYSTVWYIDTAENKMTLVRNNADPEVAEIVQRDIKRIGDNYDAFINGYLAWHVLPEEAGRLRHQTSIKELLEHVPYNDIYRINYIKKNPKTGRQRHFQICFARDVNAEGNVCFACGFRDVEEMFLEEQKQRQELEERELLITGLSREYTTVWYVDTSKAHAKLARHNEEGLNMDYVMNHIPSASYENIMQVYINQFVAPQDRERLHRETQLSKLLTVVPPNDIYRIDYVRLNFDGEERHFQICYARDKNAEGADCFACGFRDVEEMFREEQKKQQALTKARSEAEAANEAKTQFLFNMSHDIRTPMNAVIGFTNLLEKNIDDKAQVLDYLNKIKSSNEFLLSLMNHVLEMARIESGRMSVDEAYCNFEELMSSVHTVFEEHMKEKNIAFTCRLDVRHTEVMADATKVREIVLNILSNAMKYTPKGGRVTYEVQEIPTDKKGFALYEITIADSGIGISEEFLPKIFEAFTRERSTTQSGVLGTGLGMHIAKNLLDLIDGTVEVRSEKGKGTTFILHIPARIVPAHLKGSYAAEKKTQGDEIFKGMRILLAEDNEINAEIAKTVFEEKGFTVDVAEDGAVCVDMLKKAADDYYNFILMDIQMPNMNGYEATRAVRALADEKKANIPILAMTANAFEEDKREAYLSGMNAHIAKPFNLENLFKGIHDVLEHRDYFISHSAMAEFRRKYEEQGIPCGFFVYYAEEEQSVLYADSATVSIFGCETREEFVDLVGGSFKTLVCEKDRGRVMEEIEAQHAAKGNAVAYVRYGIVRRDGSLRRLTHIGYKVYDGEHAVYYAFLADITGIEE